MCAILIAFGAAAARADQFSEILSNPFHPANPMYQQNVQNVQEAGEAWAKMGPSKPTFATRVGSGIALTALTQAGFAFLNGDLSFQYLSSQEFWRPVIGSGVGGALGALVPGGIALKAFTSMAGAALGGSALSAEKQDWTMNIATALGGAGLAALMSPLPGGAFIGAAMGQVLAALVVFMARELMNSRPTKSEPLLGERLSLLGVAHDGDRARLRGKDASDE